MTIYPPPQAPPAKCYQCGQTITGAADAHQCRSDAMTDYTDLKRRLEAEIAAIMGPAGADYSVEPVTFYMECKAAIAALEAEVGRLRGELHRLPDIVHAIPTQYEDFDGTMRDTTAEWVHGRAYNTVYERVRAALTDQPR